MTKKSPPRPPPRAREKTIEIDMGWLMPTPPPLSTGRAREATIEVQAEWLEEAPPAPRKPAKAEKKRRSPKRR